MIESIELGWQACRLPKEKYLALKKKITLLANELCLYTETLKKRVVSGSYQKIEESIVFSGQGLKVIFMKHPLDSEEDYRVKISFAKNTDFKWLDIILPILLKLGIEVIGLVKLHEKKPDNVRNPFHPRPFFYMPVKYLLEHILICKKVEEDLLKISQEIQLLIETNTRESNSPFDGYMSSYVGNTAARTIIKIIGDEIYNK